MKVLEFIYNENTISFNPTGNDDVLVNATEMAKVFGKDLWKFTKSDHAKEFIKSCLKPPYGGLLGVKDENDLIVSRQKSGTWMHKILALKFAAWLDPEFELWVWLTIDKIILGHYREVKAAMYERLAAEKAVEAKREQLLKENPAFLDFLDLEGKVTEAEKKRVKALKASMDQFRLDFKMK